MLDWNNTLGVVKQTKSKYPKEEIVKEIGGHWQRLLCDITLALCHS